MDELAPEEIAIALIPEKISGALWIIFVASFVIIELISWLYFRSNRNIDLKRRFHKWSTIVYGTMFFLLIALTFTGLSYLLIFIGAAIAFIMYLNIRNLR
jgi:hypothetical protein